MSPDRVPESRFLTAPLLRLFFANALPMVLVMSLGAVLNLIDAAFLGHYVGPAALEAVSLSFPLVLVTIALSASGQRRHVEPLCPPPWRRGPGGSRGSHLPTPMGWRFASRRG